MDFTLQTYLKLLDALQNSGFSFQPFITDLLGKPAQKTIILRHDVDRSPGNSLEFAEIQAEKGIQGTYYFRANQISWNEKVIRKIAKFGNEIGYHYEDLSTTAQRHRGSMAEKELVKLAIERFAENLEKLRKIVPVKTICMHGSPMSRWDSRLLWKYYDYHDFEIIGEPYFDVDFKEVMYLTDTGRRWDGNSVNIRDKSLRQIRQEINKKGIFPSTSPLDTEASAKVSLFPYSLKLHSTFDIIQAAKENRLPDKIMITFHPQRWSSKTVPWVKELIWQNVKNTGKYFLIKMSS